MHVDQRLRDRLDRGLRASRHEVTARGHDWDVADALAAVTGVLSSPDTATNRRDPELEAALLAGATLRLAAREALLEVDAIIARTDKGSPLHGRLLTVARSLDVAEAGLTLDRTRDEHGRSTAHPDYSGRRAG